MRREEYCVNPTIDGIKQESDYALHVLKLQKAKTVIDTSRIEPPPHFKQQKDYNQKMRKDMYLQSEYFLSLIPSKDNPQPHPPKARNINEMFRFKQTQNKKTSKKTKNGHQEQYIPSHFFLTQNQVQQFVTPNSKKRPINYYDFDKESYSPTGETILSIPSDDSDVEAATNDSSALKKQAKKQKQLSDKFNSRYYKPERLTEGTDNSTEDLSSTNDDQNKEYRFQLNHTSNDNMTGIEVDDNDFDYNLIFQSKKNNNADKNRANSTPKPKSSRNTKTNPSSDPNDIMSSNEKKEDSISDAFVSNPNSPKQTKSSKKTYPISPTQQLAKLDPNNSSTQPSSYEKRTIRVKRKRIIRRRVPKKHSNLNPEEEEAENTITHYTYAKTTNGKPYQILFLKPNEAIPPNSAIVQMDTTRVVIVRSAAPLEIVETDNSVSHLQMPNNSILVLPNQKSLLKKFTIKKTNIMLPSYSSFVVTSLDDKPLHFIYIQPDREVPPNAFLVNRDNRIRVGVQGQLKLTQIKLGDPLPPNSIRTPSFINQPRRTVCVVSQDNEVLNFVTVRNGDESQLPQNSIVVSNDFFTKTAVVSNSKKPLEYVTVIEGGKIPQNAVILSSNVIKKKPPRVAVFPSKSSDSEGKEEEDFLAFVTVKNGDELPLNSIVVKSDDQNILALAPFDENQKIQSVLVDENEELPKGAVFVDLSQDRIVPNVGIDGDEPLDVVTFSNKNEVPKDSVILKEDDRITVALIPPQNGLLFASSFKSNGLNDDLQISPNSFIIESSLSDEKSAINRVTVMSPDKQPLNVITLKDFNDLPQNSAIVSTVKYDRNEGNNPSNIKRVIAAVPQNDQPLQMVNISNVDDREFLSKIPKNAHFISTHDNDTDSKVSDKIRFAVKSPDGNPLNVITVMNEDDIPHNAAVIRNDEKATIAVVSPNNQPLQLVTLKNGEDPPQNSFVLPKNDPSDLNGNDQIDSEKIYNDKIAVTSNDGKPLKVLTLNENEEVPQNAMIIESGDFGNVVAVSQDNKEIRLLTIKNGQKIPSNSLEIPINKKNKNDTENKTKLCVVSPDNDPLQLITLKHGDELPTNSFVIENDDDKITAVTSNKAIQILSINEGEETPKNAILISNNSQKFAFTAPNEEPLSITTINSNEEIPKNSKIIRSDGKTSIAITSPSDQPLLISTLKDGEKPPKNSFVFDPTNNDPKNDMQVALFSKNKQQLNIVTLKPSDDLPQNSILVKSDKDSSVAISSPNSQPLRCVTFNKDDIVPPNSYIFRNTKSLFVPFASRISNDANSESHHSDDMNDNDNDYNEQSEYEENNNNNNQNSSKENQEKFESIFNDLSKSLMSNDPKSNDPNDKSKKSPRLIVESSDQTPLKFITLNDDDEIPQNSIIVPCETKNGYKVYITSPTDSPLKFVTPESFDNDRDKHTNAVDITKPNLFVVSTKGSDMNIVTVKTGTKLPPNSAIISQDDDKTVAVVGDPSLFVNSLKSDSNSEELPPNSIQPLISLNFRGTENDSNQSSLKDKNSSFKVAVMAPSESPLYLVTLKKDDQIPQNSVIIKNEGERIVYAVSSTKYPLKCQIIGQNDPVPPSSFIASQSGKDQARIAIYTENGRQFHFATFNKNDEVPPNSFIIQSDENYKETITSPTNSPLCFFVLNDDEETPENTFVCTINGMCGEVMKNCAVASSDNSPLCVSMVKSGEKLPNNSVIISSQGGKVVSLAPSSEFKPLLFYANSPTVPESAVFLDHSGSASQLAVFSKDGKALNYTIVKDGADSQFPKNSFIIDTEGGPNPRSLAVVSSEGQRLLYVPIRDPNQLKKLPKNSVLIDRHFNDEDELSNKSKIVVRGQDCKPLKFLTINKNDELPENSIVIHSELNGKMVVAQAMNKKPLQFLILGENEELPKNAITISNDRGPIERIVVMSSALTAKENDNENVVSEGEKVNEPLQYVILKPNEETPQNAAVIKREGGRHPRRLAVKSPNGHPLKYLPIKVGDEIPPNSVTFCRQPSLIDSYMNNNGYDNDNASVGVFNKTGKAAVAVTSSDPEKPFQYIIAKFGDRLPRTMVALFKEGGNDPRTVAINSSDESSSPLRFFFVNPGGELPPNSVFLDESEVRKSIAVLPGPGSDPILDYEEIGIDDEIPLNSVVVSTIKRDGKWYRIIVKSNDNSPLLPSLTRPGFEPRNAIVINRGGLGNDGNDKARVSNYDDIMQQLNQLKILKEKRNKILSGGGQFNSPDDDDSHTSASTQTNLSAEAFMKDALERFDLYLANADDAKSKKVKKMVKRKKKKSDTNKDSEEEEELQENGYKAKTNSPFERIMAPSSQPGKRPLTFGGSQSDNDDDREKPLLEEEEEDHENTEEKLNSFISPIQKQRTPITTLVQDRETLRKQFTESPVKIDDGINSVSSSRVFQNEDEASWRKQMFTPNAKGARFNILSARDKKLRAENKFDVFRSYKPSSFQKNNILNETAEDLAVESQKKKNRNSTNNNDNNSDIKNDTTNKLNTSTDIKKDTNNNLNSSTNAKKSSNKIKDKSDIKNDTNNNNNNNLNSSTDVKKSSNKIKDKSDIKKDTNNNNNLNSSTDVKKSTANNLSNSTDAKKKTSTTSNLNNSADIKKTSNLNDSSDTKNKSKSKKNSGSSLHNSATIDSSNLNIPINAKNSSDIDNNNNNNVSSNDLKFKLNIQNVSDIVDINSDPNNDYGDEDDEFLHLSSKTFTYSNQFKNEMDENNNEFQRIPFRGMVELLHIDKDIIQGNNLSARPQSRRSNSSLNTPKTPKTPTTPKTPKTPKTPTTPKPPAIPERPNSIRFI